MANGAGTPAATPNPFGPQQPATPMGGGASPLSTGGGMGGQQPAVTPYANQPPAGSLPSFARDYVQQMPQQNAIFGGNLGQSPQQAQQAQQGYFAQLGQQQPQQQMPQQNPYGLDQRAVNANPQGFQQYMQQMQQREQQMPGSTMLGQQQPQQQMPQQQNQIMGGAFTPQNMRTIGGGNQQQPMSPQQQQPQQQMPQQSTVPSFAQNYLQQQQPQPMGQQAAQRQSDMLQGIESLLQSSQTPTASNRPRRTSRLFGGR